MPVGALEDDPSVLGEHADRVRPTGATDALERGADNTSAPPLLRTLAAPGELLFGLTPEPNPASFALLVGRLEPLFLRLAAPDEVMELFYAHALDVPHPRLRHGIRLRPAQEQRCSGVPRRRLFQQPRLCGETNQT
jgi:hypothetical protein